MDEVIAVGWELTTRGVNQPQKPGALLMPLWRTQELLSLAFDGLVAASVGRARYVLNEELKTLWDATLMTHEPQVQPSELKTPSFTLADLGGMSAVRRWVRLCVDHPRAVKPAVGRMGGVVVTADGGVVPQNDPDDPMRAAFRQFVGLMAELEAGMIRKRLRDGRRKKAELGGYAGGGVPYGSQALDKELVEDGEQLLVIERIKSMRAQDVSLRAIAERLNADGVPTARRGGRWHPNTAGLWMTRHGPPIASARPGSACVKVLIPCSVAHRPS